MPSASILRTHLLATGAWLALNLAAGDIAAEEFAPVLHRRSIEAERLPIERTSIGQADDYKPCIARLPDGELHVVAFHQHQLDGGKVREDMIRFRSTDGGRTWSDQEPLDLLGREPYYSVLRDGTMLITVHLLDADIRNRDGYVHSYLHRSTDRGQTWSSLKITPADLPIAQSRQGNDAWTFTSRNVLELADGSLILGVSVPGGNDYLWRSRDGGQTWDKSLAAEFAGVPKDKLWWPFFGETVFFQARSGDLLAIQRVDQKVFPPLPNTVVPKEASDQYERMIVYRSRDGGAHWKLDEPLGSYYGEMYPALLRLADSRLLLTFTVRSVREPLGVQAVLGTETEAGFRFDFAHDRVVIDQKTPPGTASGGGFGPTVQLDDGTLVTAYSYRDARGQTHLEAARWRLP